MDQGIRNKLRNVVTQSRKLLEEAVAQRMEGRFTIFVRGKSLIADRAASVTHLSDEERLVRAAVLEHFELLHSQGTSKVDAYRQLVREVAFTWLNRFVAFKMLEARKLIRETISRWEDSNGFKHWLAGDGREADLADYERGGESRSAVYHRFLLARCGELTTEIRVLFDPDNLASRLAPPTATLRELTQTLNAPDLAPAWQTGNEETLGWVYQDFTSEELEAAFREARVSKKKFEAEDIAPVTQLFTQNWIVRFLVHNTLGTLWLEMHPDSRLADQFEYHVPRNAAQHKQPVRSIRSIRLLDPACGTMHFGLVAFDLFVAMYREELERVGEPGWPEQSPVASAEEIPAAILADNLHGIDIDMRAVQISALALYLKAKMLAPKRRLTESRLVCANIHILNGDRLDAFLTAAKLNERPIYGRILKALQHELKLSEQLGSLLPLEQRIRELVEAERLRYLKEGHKPDLFGWSREQFETDAGQREYWEILEIQIGQALDAFAREQAQQGINQTFFAEETVRGLRLLEIVGQTYDVVVTNPPYMAARKMNATIKQAVADLYPAAKGDLYAAFGQRCLALTHHGGRVGMLTMHSFMFISSYEKYREALLAGVAIESLLHAGPALFDVGNPGTLQTAAYTLRREPDAGRRDHAEGIYFRLVKEPDAQSKRVRFEQALARLRQGETDPIVYRYRQADFAAIPGSPWVYWITPGLRSLFETLPKLGDVAVPRVGLQTGENFRFLRFWWEAGTLRIAFGCRNAREAQATGQRWFPYMKGGSFQRWYGNQEYVVNWENDGKEIKNFAPAVVRNPDYYFRRGVTWTDLTSGRFSARLSPGGFIFDVKGSSAFPENVEFALALLNSSIAHYMLSLLNPTVSFQVGDLARLPIPRESSPTLQTLVERAIALAKRDSEEDETTWDFIAPPVWPDGLQRVAARHAELAELEHQIDEEVYRLYGIREDDRQAIERELAESQPNPDADEDGSDTPPDADESSDDAGHLTRDELAHQWLSYAVGIVLGPFQPGDGVGRGAFDERLLAIRDQDGLTPVDADHPQEMAGQVWSALDIILGDTAAAEIVREALGPGSPHDLLRGFLADKYFKNHIQQYRKRPIYWLLQSSKKNYALWLYYHRLDKDMLFKALVNYVEPKIRLETSRLETLRSQKTAAGDSGKEAKRFAKDIERQEDFLSELRDFEDKLRRAANLHLEPDLNDGVVLNIALLHELVPWKEAKKYWDELLAGKYEWSAIGQQLRQKGLVKC